MGAGRKRNNNKNKPTRKERERERPTPGSGTKDFNTPGKVPAYINSVCSPDPLGAMPKSYSGYLDYRGGTLSLGESSLLQ